jgi:hypothetical protein
MKLIPVLHNGKIHRLSELAIELLGLEKVEHKERPIEIQKLPPNLEIIRIQKKEAPVVVAPVEAPVEMKAAEPVVVKKKADAESAVNTDVTKRKRRGSKVGTKE